jgi:Domain of unknown function (DUF4203)
MLPQSYQLAGAGLIVLGGLLACFAGYRLFRVVLVVYGFILGALVASSVMGTSNTTGMIMAALGGGLAGAAILFAAYFVGVALVGAALGALVAHVVWSGLAGDPHPLVVIAFSVVGAIGAMVLQRYVIIVGTAFGGAWTLIVGALALLGREAALSAAERPDVWIVYPLDPTPGRKWVLVAWVALSVAGLVVQMAVTGTGKRKR